MLRSVKSLRGFKILGTDEKFGHAHEFYFDDKDWVMRYLVVDTGGWLTGRRVLICPVAFGQPDWEMHMFPILLSKQQIEQSPTISDDKPVSKQKEIDLVNYYNWPVYWPVGHTGIPANEMAVTRSLETQREEREQEDYDPNLRSTREVISYFIHATDGDIGHVEDFIVDDETWTIRYLVVDTKNILPGKNVLISPMWVESINWADAKVYVFLTKESIKNSPEFDPSQPINREYEEILYDYYGRPKYWKA